MQGTENESACQQSPGTGMRATPDDCSVLCCCCGPCLRHDFYIPILLFLYGMQAKQQNGPQSSQSAVT